MSTVLSTPHADGSAGHDLSPIKAILAKWLVGRPYLFGRETYKAELTVHFGERRPYASAKMADKTRGTHVLSVRASAWVLQSGTRSVMISDGLTPLNASGEPRAGQTINSTVLESGQFVAPGATVVRADPLEVGGDALGGIALSVQLTDGTTLMVIPTATDPADTLADWELLTPDGLLRVGPGSNHVVESNS